VTVENLNVLYTAQLVYTCSQTVTALYSCSTFTRQNVTATFWE